jgi:DNA repair protein RecN (Recombination protein N)
MIEYLRIRNVTLIKDVVMEFAPGLNALTGETGAGKSFILKSLEFLTGEQASADFVRAGEEKAVVEAVFQHAGKEKLLRREISAQTGRSRIFVDEDLSTLAAVKALKSELYLYTSQHKQQKLLSPNYQAELLDAFLPDLGLLRKKDELATRLRKVTEARRKLAEASAVAAERRDVLVYQAELIAAVAPKPGEEEELSAKKTELKARAESAQSIEGALAVLHNEGTLLENFRRLLKEIERLGEIMPDFGDDAARLQEMWNELGDLDHRLRRLGPETDEHALEAVESRLFELSKLKRKLGRSLDEIISLEKDIQEQVSLMDGSALEDKRLADEERSIVEGLSQVLSELGRARRAAAQEMCTELTASLKELGFSEGLQLSYAFRPKTPFPEHPDLVEDKAGLLWAPNPGQAPQALDKIASGGELSRFMLALTGLLSSEGLPTLLFDEVDTGIGGHTLNKVADRIHELAAMRQVILITHWPQLAVGAAEHFHVEKHSALHETTVTCTKLQSEAVFQELKRMGGGGSQGEALAKELMKQR